MEELQITVVHEKTRPFYGPNWQDIEHPGWIQKVHEPKSASSNGADDGSRRMLRYSLTSAASWLVGDFQGELAARDISVENGRLAVKAVGGLKHDNGEIVLEQVSIEYQLKVASASEEAAREAFERHAFSSPIAKSLARSVRIKTRLSISVED